MQTESSHPDRAPALLDLVLSHRPSWILHELGKPATNVADMTQSLLALVNDQETRSQAQLGLLLVCLGHPTGAQRSLQLLRAEELGLRNYLLDELASIYAHAPAASALSVSKVQLVEAMRPMLGEPQSSDGRRALRFCLQYAFEESRPYTRVLLGHAERSVRSRAALAYLQRGFDAQSLAVAVEHWLGDLPDSQDQLSQWRTLADQYASAVARHVQRLTADASASRELEETVSIVIGTVEQTLSLPDAMARSWYWVDHRSGRGHFNQLLEILGGTGSDAAGLLRQVAASDALAGYSRALAAVLGSKMAGQAMPEAAAAIVAMVADRAVSEHGRAPLLERCVQALGETALDGLLLALQEQAMREAIVSRTPDMLRMSGARAGELTEALRSALREDTRAWVQARLANALASFACVDDEMMQAMDPWQRMQIHWQRREISIHDVARRLAAAGACHPMSDDALAGIEALDAQDQILALLSNEDGDGVRLAVVALRDDGFDPRHDELFHQLTQIARPKLEVQDIEQTRQELVSEQAAESAGLRMWQDGEWKPAPVSGIPVVRFQETSCELRFGYAGLAHAFSLNPNGSWMDVDGVMQAFNAFMITAGRKDRAFRLAADSGGSYHAFLLCADETGFLEAAAELRIPLDQGVKAVP